MLFIASLLHCFITIILVIVNIHLYWMLGCFIVSLFLHANDSVLCIAFVASRPQTSFESRKQTTCKTTNTLHVVTFVGFFPSTQHFFCVNITQTQQQTKTNKHKNSITVRPCSAQIRPTKTLPQFPFKTIFKKQGSKALYNAHQCRIETLRVHRLPC